MKNLGVPFSQDGTGVQLEETRPLQTEYRKPFGAVNNLPHTSTILLFDSAPGGIKSMAITGGGSGYSNAAAGFAVSYTGGGGTGAAGIAYASGGVIVYYQHTNAGSGYTSAPTPVFTAGGGTGATGTATLGVSGPGNLEMIQLAFNGATDGGTWLDGYISIFIDGEGTASLQMPAGDFFASRNVPNGTTIWQGIVPSAPTITQNGVSGSTNYSYTVTAVGAVMVSVESVASTAGNTTTGNSILTSINSNGVSWTAVSGATGYNVYRTVGGTTQGKIGSTTSTSLTDTGLVGSDASPQITVRNLPVKRVSITNNTTTSFGAHRLLFCPWKTSIKVTFTNISSSGVYDQAIYSQVEYRIGTIPNWKTGLRRGRLRQVYTGNIQTVEFGGQFVVATHFSFTTLANISNAGELESVTLAIINGNGTSPVFMEGHFIVTADGKTMEYGGTEDFFGNQFFGLNHICSDKWGMPGSDIWNSTGYAMQGYRIWDNADDVQIFNSSLLIQWQNGLADKPDPGSSLLTALVLYYTES